MLGLLGSEWWCSLRVFFVFCKKGGVEEGIVDL